MEKEEEETYGQFRQHLTRSFCADFLALQKIKPKL
jgi:hypothetical protein